MLKILDINKFIKNNNCKEVTNYQSFNKDLTPTDDGLYSSLIFGVNQTDNFTKFGYISFGINVLHPVIYKNIVSVNGLFKKVLNKETKVKIINGKLEENEAGWTGIKELYNNWDKINFKNYDEKNIKVKSLIEFLNKNNKNLIFINKILVIPVNFRPAVPKNGLMVEDEISGLYKGLLTILDNEKANSEYLQNLMSLTDKYSIIQSKVNDIYNNFITFLEKKDGLIRTSLIGKRVNNVARLVANAQPIIPLNCIVLPWHACLNIFDLPIIGMINNDPFGKNYLTKLKLNDLSPDDLADLFGFIYHNVDTYSKNNIDLLQFWYELLLDTFNYHKELKCFVKRDPAWDKNSYHLLQPVINTENEFSCIINSALYNPLGGDSFSTNYTLIERKNSIIDQNEFGELILPNNRNSIYIKSIKKIYESFN